MAPVSCAGHPRGLQQPASLPEDVQGRSPGGGAHNLERCETGGRVWIKFKFRESLKRKKEKKRKPISFRLLPPGLIKVCV